ncbi:nucleotidyltransferase family protein [Dehalococcoidia bacterium]|nr:nucleotidyltransferase family protein [Dehalococcoidia bacterium]
MNGLEEQRKVIRQHRQELEDRFKVKSIAIFGSYARGDANEGSDIDILVEFTEPVGILFIHLADFLEDILGVRVDMITSDAIKPNRLKYVMENLVYA